MAPRGNTVGTIFAAAMGLSLTIGAAQADEVQKLEPVLVTGHYENAVGSSDAASAGVITPQLIDDRALLRPGEVLEYIPGMIVTQHSGAGKANQYFLRGFNLDHGTDFSTYIAGMPVNMRSHAHGQGYTDLNFMIPELISRVDYFKGPYYASQGDFATAGGANIHYFEALKRNLAELTVGQEQYARALLIGSTEAGHGQLLYGFEAFHNNGPWENPDNYRKYNAILRYTQPTGEGQWGVTAMAYAGKWNATDQIPLRAVNEGLVDRFGAIDASDGGKSSRYSLSFDYQTGIAGGQLQTTAYGIRYYLSLFSNFTYFLDHPDTGDQFNQVDDRKILGWNGRWVRSDQLFGKQMQNTFGWDFRHDRINPVGLYDTIQRQQVATTRQDNVVETSYALYFENQTQWSDWLRTIIGVRGDRYTFNVASDNPANSGNQSANLVSPKLSIVMGPWNKSEFFVNAGYGFHSNDARGTTTTIDPKSGEPVEPVTPLVRTFGAELGARTEAIRDLQSSLAIWYLKFDSELVFLGDAGTTEAGRPSTRYGVEWNNEYTPVPWLLIDFDFAWTHARFTNDDPVGNHIPNALQTVAAVGVTLRNLGPWTASIFGRYFGPASLIEDNSARSNSTTVFNLQATYQFNPQTRFRLDMFNLFNAKTNDITYYYTSRLPGEPPEGVNDYHFHPSDPRTFRLGLLYNF
jgi:outer membrane receptor protein involved in Fe transport